MGKTRGLTGTVRGIEAGEVTSLLVRLLQQLGPQFERAEAAAFIRRDRQGIGTGVVEALLHALTKVPGVRHEGTMYHCVLSSKRAAYLAHHRTWRMAMPHLNLDDALTLLEALKGNSSAWQHLTPTLLRLRDRLGVALEGVE